MKNHSSEELGKISRARLNWFPFKLCVLYVAADEKCLDTFFSSKSLD